MFIHDVCDVLKKAKISYAIVGGYAVAFHGAVRGTVDVDIAIMWNLENLKNLEQALITLGLVSAIPVNAENVFYFRNEYIQTRHLITWNFYDTLNPLNQVDIIITYDLQDAKVDTFRTPFGDIKVLSIRDLIAMKKASGRPQDIEDVKALETLCKNRSNISQKNI